MKKYLLLMVLCLTPSILFCETLRFRYDLWEDYRLVTKTEQDVYFNGELLEHGLFTSKASFERLETDGEISKYSADLLNLEQIDGIAISDILEVSAEHKFQFDRDRRGYITIEEDSLYPVLRNMLILPEGEVQPGDQWTEIGEEVHDMSRSYDVDYIRFPRRVLYTYKGEVPYQDSTCHLIETSSQFSVNPDYPGTPRGYFYPYQVSGYSKRQIYWDNETGRPLQVIEEFYISFLLADLQSVDYTGTRSSLYEYPDPVNREQEMEEVQQILDEQGIGDTEVTGDDEGMILTLNRIHFAPDSYEIQREEEQRIHTLAEILSRFPGRDIVISGHTADVGNPGFQQQLSIDRATAVAGILAQLLGERSGLIITRGFGGTQPVADNDTELGRAQNRRVELKILDN